MTAGSVDPPARRSSAQTPLTTVVSSTLGSAFNTSEGHRRIICRSASLVSPPPTLSFVAAVALAVPPTAAATPPLFPPLPPSPRFSPCQRSLLSVTAAAFQFRLPTSPLAVQIPSYPLPVTTGSSCSVTVDICTRLTSLAPLCCFQSSLTLFFFHLLASFFFPSSVFALA